MRLRALGEAAGDGKELIQRLLVFSDFKQGFAPFEGGMILFLNNITRLHTTDK
jgi:hypothetical protein